MPSDPNIFSSAMPGQRNPIVSPPVPSFGMLPRGSMLQRVKSNFAECITAPPKGLTPWQFAVMFRSAYFPKRFPTRPLLHSILLHVCALTYLTSEPAPPSLRSVTDEVAAARAENRIIYYRPADRLPPVSPLEAEPPRRSPTPPTRLRIARSIERVISRPPRPDNARQTIVQPEVPELKLPTDVEIPNIVAVRPVPPPPPSVSEAQQQLAALRVPRVPAPAVAAPVPVPPRLTMPEVSVPAAPSAGLPSAPVPPRPSVAEAQQQLAALRLPRMPNLVAVGVAPAPPPVRIEIPRGNRWGEFAVSPDGEELQAGRSGQSLEGTASREAPALPDLAPVEVADIRVPNLSIAGDRGELPPPPVSIVPELPEPSVEPLAGPRSTISSSVQPERDLRTLMARATRPSFPEMTRGKDVQAEPAAFGDRRVYTVYINMPNLSSGAGSWILRFAERDGDAGRVGGSDETGGDEEISSPVAVKKVDPKYTPQAIRERVEGTVTLAAQILRSGRVTSVKVVQGLDPRLDLSAVQALTLWQFEPARKKGVPIDLEVLVQIPFRLPAF